MEACECPLKGKADGKVLTRIYVEKSGDIVVTDLWEDLRQKLLSASRGFDEKDQDI